MKDRIAAAHTAVADAERLARAAATDHSDAAGTASALEDRLTAGDDDVTPEELAGARAVAEFAQLRARGAAAKLSKAKAAHHQALVAELEAEVASHADDPDEFDAALAALEDALAAFLALGRERAAAFSRYRARAHALGQDIELRDIDLSPYVISLVNQTGAAYPGATDLASRVKDPFLGGPLWTLHERLKRELTT